jgi:hypothetical protein
MKNILVLLVIALSAVNLFGQESAEFTIKNLKDTTFTEKYSKVNEKLILKFNKSEIICIDSVLFKESDKLKNDVFTSDTTNSRFWIYSKTKILDSDTNITELKIKAYSKENSMVITLKIDKGEQNNTSDNYNLDSLLINYFKSQKIDSRLDENDNKIIEGLLSGKRYFHLQDVAYILLDSVGNRIGNKPSNLDQDDRIKILTIHKQNQKPSFKIECDGIYQQSTNVNIVDGESSDKVNKQNIGNNRQPNDSLSNWTISETEIGPFTSDKFDLKIGDNKNSFSTNKLYHATFGTAVIFTTVPNYAFGIFPLTDSLNTVKRKNQSSVEPMLSFNVTWFWQNTLSHFFKDGSDLMRGRDIMKEPSWYQRINPTFGLAIDNEGKIFDNCFLGLNFEFARGGSITFGAHLRKTQQLALKNPDGSDFSLGTDIFRGTEAEITTIDDWKCGFFFGIALDTRIFEKFKK